MHPKVFENEYLRRSIVPLLVFGSALVLMHTQRANWVQRLKPRQTFHVQQRLPVPRDKQVVGTIDTPDVNRVITRGLGSYVVLSGWVASVNPNLRIEGIVLRLDGKVALTSTDLYERPDVAAIYGRPDFLMSGWSMHLQLMHLRPGMHLLSVEAVTAAKEPYFLGAVKLDVTNVP